MDISNILSTAAQNALPSGIRRMFELAGKYDDAINLTLGEPGFTAPEHIIEASIRGLKDKIHPQCGNKRASGCHCLQTRKRKRHLVQSR